MAAGITHARLFAVILTALLIPRRSFRAVATGISLFLSPLFSVIPAHASLLLASLSRIICTEPSLISKRALSPIHFAIRCIHSALQRGIAYAFSIACNQHGIALHVSFVSHACSVVVHIACCVAAFLCMSSFHSLVVLQQVQQCFACGAVASSHQRCVVHSFC